MKCIAAELWLTLTVFVSQKWKSNREIGCQSLKSAYKSQAVVAPLLFATAAEAEAEGTGEKDWLRAFDGCIHQTCKKRKS